MKDFSYKDHILNIEELSNFNIDKGSKYRGTTFINDKKHTKKTSTIKLLISWFKSTVDYLNETILHDQICKSWGSSYKRIEYKGRWLTITIRRRYKDSKVIYLGEFCNKDYRRSKSVESIYLDKVIFKFQRFVDEYCTDWRSYSSIPYKRYQLWISEEYNGNNYFGTCEIHKNSTFKCISSSIKEIEVKFEARVDKILKCKEDKKKPVSSKLDRLIEMTEEASLYEYF